LSKISNQFIYIFVLFTLFYFTGCNNAKVSQNTALSYYKKIIDTVNMGRDTLAQESLLSLLSKYPQSSFIEPSLFLMINYYVDNKSYDIASIYLKKLKENFLNKSNKDYILYLQINLEYKKIQSLDKNQEQVINIMEKLQNFLDTYPDSRYKHNVSTMYSHLYLSNILNNENIASLYKRLDKKEANLFYKKKNEDIDISYIYPPSKSFFEQIF
jgi:outer membrane protein assembly factor BamD